MAPTAPAMTLALVDGKARLTLERRDLGPSVSGRLEVEWPNVTALPEDKGEWRQGNGLRNRRGRLRTASLFVGGARLEQRTAGATLPAGGISRLDLTLEKGRIGEVYNLGGGNERPNVVVAKAILEHVGAPESLIEFVKDRPGHDRRYAIDCGISRAAGSPGRST